jgi:small-conductance mechanosensitive channel
MFQVVEMILWFTFAFWASHKMFMHLPIYNLLTAGMALLLIAIVGWYLLRDFISGIILKAENGFESGQRIITSEGSGTIKKLGYRSIEIMNSDGESIKIPFSRLSTLNITRPAEAGKWVEHLARFIIYTSHSTEKIQKLMMLHILEMLWIVSGNSIKIKISLNGPDFYQVAIHFHSISPEMAIKTEENLQVFVNEELG